MLKKKLNRYDYQLNENMIHPEIINKETIGSINIKNKKIFITSKLDGTQLNKTRLDQDCKFGCIYNGIFWLYGYNTLYFSENQGRRFQKIEIKLNTNEKIGAINIHKDNIFISTYRTKNHKLYGLNPRIIKISYSGDTLWASFLPINRISYTGVIYMSANNEWKPKEKQPWKPETWIPYYKEGLMLSDKFVLASYFEMPRSGIGCRYVLDIETGDLIWKSNAGPIANTTVLRKNRFLLGSQGYGAFETSLLENGNNEKTKWASNGKCFETNEGRIISIQLSNHMGTPQYVVELCDNGEIKELSSSLPGYYTSNLIKMLNGDVYFWRGNILWKWNNLTGSKQICNIGLKEGYGSPHATAHKISEDKFALFITNHIDKIWSIFEIG